MPTISSDAPGVALIHVFEVEPGTADELVSKLQLMTERVARHEPGFVSSSLHRGKDGMRVANYAQWRSKADFDAILQNPHAQELTAGKLYEVAHVEKAVPQTEIVEGSAPLTLIVAMNCEPGEQGDLTQYLIGIAQEHASNPGFISCNIHRSLDGTRVVEYIQWRDRAALSAMANKPASQAHFERVKHRSSSSFYDVVKVL